MAKTIVSKGIDVTYAHGKIDWAKVKSNIDGAIFRVGYGSDSISQGDAQFANSFAGREKYEIPYGVYLSSYASDFVKDLDSQQQKNR